MDSKAYSHDKVHVWLNESFTIRARPMGLLTLPDRSYTAGEAFENIRNSSEESLLKNLDDAGRCFELPENWWKRDEQLYEPLMEPLAATMTDAWIYYCWLKESNKQREADVYLLLFQKILTNSELFCALDSMRCHYPMIGGNDDQVLPDLGEFILSKQRKKFIWMVTPRKPSSPLTLGEKRANDSYNFLRDVFLAKDENKDNVIKSGLEHITYAGIHGDTLFFERLGRAISTKYEPPKHFDLLDLCQLPLKKKAGVWTPRGWYCRLWVSRGYWLMPKNECAAPPFDINEQTRKPLTAPVYGRNGEKRAGNDGLYVSTNPYFKSSKNSAKHSLKSHLPLTSAGSSALAGMSDTEFLWEVVCLDFIYPT